MESVNNAGRMLSNDIKFTISIPKRNNIELIKDKDLIFKI
jgi:hypothetical protein